MAFFDGTARDIEDNRNKKSTYDGTNPSETAYLSELGVKTALDTKVDKNAVKIAIGRRSNANNDGNIAIGIGAEASGDNSIVIGEGIAEGNHDISIGAANSSGDYSVVIGYGGSSSSREGIAIGYDAAAQGFRSIQLGHGLNMEEGSFAVYSYSLLDANGKIPIERLDKLVSLLQGLKTASSIAEINALASEILGDENG